MAEEAPAPAFDKPEQVLKLEEAVKSDPYDVNSWTELLRLLTAFR